MEIEIGDILLCQVEKIEGTTVFVNIENSPTRGTIILSEVSAGRIRNLRDYVVPKKTIVCKVLRIMADHIELSLRRVTQKEQKEVMEQNKIEKSYLSIFKSVLKEKTKETIDKIKEKQTLFEFVEEIKENQTKLEKLVGNQESKEILEILKTQKKKTIQLKKEIKFHSTHPEGLKLIKEILGNSKDTQIKYLAAGKYSIKSESDNIKIADQKIEKTIEEIQNKIKGQEIEFSYK